MNMRVALRDDYSAYRIIEVSEVTYDKEEQKVEFAVDYECGGYYILKNITQEIYDEVYCQLLVTGYSEVLTKEEHVWEYDEDKEYLKEKRKSFIRGLVFFISGNIFAIIAIITRHTW